MNQWFSNYVLHLVNHWLFEIHMIDQSRVSTTKWSVKTEGVLSLCIRRNTDVWKRCRCESWLPRYRQSTVLTTSPHCSSWMLCFYRITFKTNEEGASPFVVSFSQTSSDCPQTKQQLGGDKMYGGGRDCDPSVVFDALRGPQCKLETLRWVPVEESSHDDNTNINTLWDCWLVCHGHPESQLWSSIF